jgi:hypothetical protein
MKALAPIDVLDFDDLLWVTSDRFDRMDAVPAVANEPTLDRSRHVSFSIQGQIRSAMVQGLLAQTPASA